MALTRDQKVTQLTGLKEALAKAKSVVFMQYAGTSVEAISVLRGKLYDGKSEMKVGKKTLFRIAAKEAGFPEITDEQNPGQIAYVFSFGDEMTGAKIALEFSKANDKVKLVGGLLNGKVLSNAEALELAKMLSHKELLAKFAAMLRAPLTNFASIASSPLRSFAYATKQMADKKPSA